MEVGRALAATPEMSSLAAHLWPSRRQLSAPARLRAWLPRATNSGYHPCGTAPMGDERDALAVCDARGRVRGTEGLYVVDASLFPTIPTGNIHLTVLMVAERLAAMLRDGSDLATS